ncbi:MAG: hypothetical protein Kow00120_05300 [Anaerolineae bacterium]
MSFRHVFLTVFKKEMTELLRDRRALLFLLAPPFILPALALCGGLFVGVQAVNWATQGFPIAVENPEAAPELAAWLAASGSLRLVDPPGGEGWGDTLLVLAFPDDFATRVAREETASVTMTTRDSTWTTGLAASAVRGVIARYNAALIDARLAARDLDRSWLTPVTIGEAQAPTEAVAQAVAVGGGEGGGAGGLGDPGALSTLFLPLAVTSWLVGGGLGLIVDTTVGEKERRTMEALLLTPASRLGIVAGKLAVVFIASVVVMSLWLAEGVLLSVVVGAAPALPAIQEGALSAADVLLQSGAQVARLVFYLVLLLLPFIVMLNSLVMAWCTFASGYRESNLLLFVVQLALPALVILAVFSLPADVGAGWYLTPLFGTVIAIRDLFSGVLLPARLAVALLSGVVYAALAMALAAYIYSREWALVRGL